MTDESQATLDRVRQAISGDRTRAEIISEALDRVRSAINGDWTRAEIISEALGSDILAATSVRRRTVHLRDMPGADPNDSRSNTYVNTHDVIAHLTETLP